MCGRFAFYSPAEATAALFGVKTDAELEPRYNVAPTQDIAAIRRSRDGELELTTLHWGLVPFWAKDPSIGNRMINARAETVADKPSFRNAFRKRRCLILADGFYEWRKEGEGKTPYFISLDSGEPMAFAGLWEDWTDKESGESLQSGTIVTTAAQGFMADLHGRMPVILVPDTAPRWFDDAGGLLENYAEATPPLRAWPVSRRVNNPRNEGEELIEKAGDVLSG
ncbi:MAG: SOS response-associated peptidase [Woeseiaceae bacterium]|nr:SOS response-associated peptidase [Woeseiaceae bacterium]